MSQGAVDPAAGMSAAPAVLSLDGIGVTFPGPPRVTALAGCSFIVAAGDAVAIVGPSGSGKSTLLSVLGLLERPTAGAYVVEGVDTATAHDRARTRLRSRTFGFVFQAFHLLADRSATENVEIPLLYQRLPAKTRRARAVEALDRVGLSHRLGANPTTLSGGERQRVAVARALAAGARVLLCDEPTGNLDTATGEAILDLLLELPAQGLTLLVVTHDRALADRLPRRLDVLDGLVTEQPTAPAAISHPSTR
jgi:putative ABC transport system ATP-binding protein